MSSAVTRGSTASHALPDQSVPPCAVRQKPAPQCYGPHLPLSPAVLLQHAVLYISSTLKHALMHNAHKQS
eukprot:13018921-Alexandrium_andersonii.AAC.1